MLSTIAFEFYIWIPMSLELQSMTLLRTCWVPMLGLFLKKNLKIICTISWCIAVYCIYFVALLTWQCNTICRSKELIYVTMICLHFISLWEYSSRVGKKSLINGNESSFNLMLYLGMGWRACSGCTKTCRSMYICTWLLQM